MRVAVFTSVSEVIVLAIKGQKKSIESVDGFADWFDKDIGTGRWIGDYSIELCHIGAGDGLIISSSMQSEAERNNNSIDINEWFKEEKDKPFDSEMS